MTRIRYFLYLKDVFILACTAFGGPQVHLMMMLERLVEKRGYLTEKELLELQGLCQLLPGPSSTQTVTALAYKIGGRKLAYLTLLVWAIPATTLMILAAIGIHYLEKNEISLSFTRFVAPMAVAFLAYGGFKIAYKVIHNSQGWGIMLLATVIAYFFPSPYMTPALIVLGAVISSLNFRKFPPLPKPALVINWRPLFLWAGIAVGVAALGLFTQSLPIRLFENFYRNGSLVFGGGQVLIPMLYTEFVDFKHYLTHQEFLSGMALTQVVPGPVFSIATYVGSVSMQPYGVGGQILGGVLATAGIFLPGTFLIFFAYRIWDKLKAFRGVRASLEGIHAASSGLTIAAAFMLFIPFTTQWQSLVTIFITLMLSIFTRIPAYIIIIGGLIAGLLL